MSLFDELKRRNVFRVGIAYAVVAWLLLQVTDVLTPVLELPGWVPKLVFVLLAIGVVPTLLFAWAFEITPEGIKRERDVDRTASVTHETAKKLDQLTIGVLVLVVAIVIVDRFVGPPAAVAPATTPDKSIAVLAFEDLSQDGDQAYFAEGLSEELLNLLAKMPDLQVAGRTSSFAFKGERRDLREIGEILNVAHVLEGSVRKAGNRVRVTAQLINTADGYHLFSETYDDELSDVFAVQDAIARQITQALKAQLIGEETATETAATDVRAYELFLEARQKIHTRKREALQEASDLLDAALIIAPDYAPALAQKAIALALLSNAPGSYGDIPFVEAYAAATRLADRALAIEPNTAEAYAIKGLIEQDDETAIALLRRALEINPNLESANIWLAAELGAAGLRDERSALLERVIARDPLFSPAVGNQTLHYLQRREFDKVAAIIDRYERAAGTDSTVLHTRARIAQAQGDYAGAVRLYERAYAEDPSSSVLRVNYASTLQSLGNLEEMRKLDMPHLEALYQAITAGDYDRDGIEALYPPDTPRFLEFHAMLYAYSDTLDLVPDVVEQAYGSLDALLTGYPQTTGSGDGYMSRVGFAYRELGLTEEFEKITRAARAALDAQRSADVGPMDYWYFELGYAELIGDIDAMVRAYEEIIALNDVDINAGYDPMSVRYRDDPRIKPLVETLRQRGHDARAELGWEPYAPIRD